MRSALAVDRLHAGHPVTPDGRYFVVRGRLWRMSVPTLAESDRDRLVKQLMQAHREIGVAERDGDQAAADAAHRAADKAKVTLGERGPVCWNDGAANYMAGTTPCADWFAALD